MKIKSLPGFTGNGVLKGTFVATDDLDNPLGWEEHGNWSNTTFVRKAAVSLAEETGIELDQARQLLMNARKAARTAVGLHSDTDSEASTTADEERPRIIVNGRFLREISAESWALIFGAGKSPEFFKFGSKLVHLEADQGRVYSRVLNRDSLIGHMDRLGDYMTAKDGVYMPAFPPKDVADNMLSESPPPVPSLEGIVNTPVIGPDGECITTEGYDPKTQLYINLNGLQVPTVPNNPLESDVSRARALILDELLFDFPFTSNSDQAHAVAALLTPLVRPMINGPTPLFLFESPAPGTGKGLLAEVVVKITTGSAPAVMTEGRGTEEWRKRITAALLPAPAVILIDNVQRPIDSASLAAALTAVVWSDRELGATRMLNLPVRCCWLATGNNVSLSGEIARRTIRSRIDAQIERPWERMAFKHAPLADWVHRNRGELCWALMTLVRAWVSAGRPEPTERIGSFEDWSKVVGGILTTAGISGFLANRSELYDQAEADGDTFRGFVEVWWDRFGGKRVSTGELFTLAKESRLLGEFRGGRSDQGARVAFGLAIAAMRDRRIETYWVRDTGKGRNGGMTYMLENAEGFETGRNQPLCTLCALCGIS